MENFPSTEAVPGAEGPAQNPSVTEAAPTEEPDTEGPVISGIQPLTALAGGTLSYRNGVTAVDDRDGPVPFQVDSSQVNLNVAGEYDVIYSAEDSSGNRTEVTTTVVVTEPESQTTAGTQTVKATLERVNALADQVLAKITNSSMSQAEKAKAIFNYVYHHIIYVGYSDKSSWIVGAYDGFTSGRGDCFNYFACSKALLTRAGIPNVDVKRVGGPTRHYWQLVDVGTGYYHFDACPHDNSYRITSFMLTDAETEEYTAWRGKNYYVYDRASCPVTVATTPYSGTAWHRPGWTPSVSTPAPTPEPTPELPVEPTVEPTPEVTPVVPVEPVPEVTPEPTPEPTPDQTQPEPEDPTQPEPEGPTQPEPEGPTQPEPEGPTQPEPEGPTQPESTPETEGQEG